MPTDSGIDIGQRHYLIFKDQLGCVDMPTKLNTTQHCQSVKQPQIIYTLGGGCGGALPIVNTLGTASAGIQ